MECLYFFPSLLWVLLSALLRWPDLLSPALMLGPLLLPKYHPYNARWGNLGIVHKLRKVLLLHIISIYSENFAYLEEVRANGIFKGACWFIDGMEKANRGASSGCKRIFKKQSFKSITVNFQSFGIITGQGKPGCKKPISWITLLTFLRSCNNLYFPLFGFLI